ncbi:hypothetical protein CAEBREN_18626 [Caenorhabditis brenneri]|uniref:Uncharacterized protein n=1 Tax=Caenorhabditis brenneri TaxID=135651 RepID=G0NXJ8_CAEBE|nr:hypothetical protein CAEBREN_18626 [Caenorhabditis brenneri]
MNSRALCILLVLVSIAFAMSSEEDKRKGSAKNAAQTASFATVASIEEKKPDESATPAKGAPATGSFFTIGALTMAAIYIV